MSLTSALAGAEDGLLERLQAQSQVPGSPLAGVPIRLGDPGVGLMQEHVFIAESASADQRFVVTGTGANQKQEQFTLRVIVWVHREGDDYTATRDRAKDLLWEIEKAVAADPTLSGKVFDSWVSGLERRGGITDTGRALETTVLVTAIAFLS